MGFDAAGIAAQLAAVTTGEVDTGRPLAPYTSYNIGGSTAVWVAPATERCVGRVLEIIHRTELPLFILGRGSNILVSDRGWKGVTLYLGDNLSAMRFERQQARVEAGTLLIDLIRAAIKKGGPAEMGAHLYRERPAFCT